MRIGLFALTFVILGQASAARSQTKAVAVFDIENRGPRLKKSALFGMTEFIATSIAATGTYQVIPRDQLQARLREQKRASYKECYEASCQIEIGKEMAAGFALSTRIVRIGSKCLVAMKMFDLRTAATAWASTGRGPCDEDSLLASIEKAMMAGLKKGPQRAPEVRSAKEPKPRSGSAACDRLRQHGLTKNGDLAGLRQVKSTMQHIDESFYDRSRIDRRAMLQSSIDFVSTCEDGLSASTTASGLRMTFGGQTHDVSLAQVKSAWQFTGALRGALQWYARQGGSKIDTRALEYEAIQGLLSALDPHSALMTPREARELKVSVKGNFGGVGVVIAKKKGRLVVMSSIDGTPAQRAGLRAGDVILAVDGVPTQDRTLSQIVNLMRGAPGTPLVMTIERDAKQRDLSMTREIIKINATHKAQLSKDINYLKIRSFQRNTANAVDAALAKSRAGLVLDLRNNPGGLLDQSTRIADRFLSSGLIVRTVGVKYNQKKHAKASSSDLRGPVVVLINEGTASAAEILAGALQKNDRAVVVGRRSFGKGAIQVLYDLPDKSSLKLSIAEYRLQGGAKLEATGIEPDITLKPSSEEDPKDPLEDPAVRLAEALIKAGPYSSRAKMLQRAGRLKSRPEVESIVGR